jgi:lipopolysaccharide export system protein LptA
VSTALALVPAAAWAQSANVWRPDPHTPLLVSAADVAIDDAAHVATFSGDVRLTQGDVRMQCSQMRVYYVAGAQPEQDRVDRIECEP